MCLQEKTVHTRVQAPVGSTKVCFLCGGGPTWPWREAFHKCFTLFWLLPINTVNYVHGMLKAFLSLPVVGIFDSSSRLWAGASHIFEHDEGTKCDSDVGQKR